MHFGQTLEQLRRLLGLAAQPPHRLAEAMLCVLPLAFLVVDVRDGQDGRQVVGDERQRLVEEAHGLGAVGESLPGGSGQIGEHRGARRRVFRHFQLAGQHAPRLFPVGFAGVQRGQRAHGLRVRRILAQRLLEALARLVWGGELLAVDTSRIEQRLYRPGPPLESPSLAQSHRRNSPRSRSPRGAAEPGRPERPGGLARLPAPPPLRGARPPDRRDRRASAATARD